MIFRTHLIIALSFGLFIIRFVDNKILFMIMLIIGAIFPDIDSEKSYLGKSMMFRPVQFFIKHRGIVHSLFFGSFAAMILALIYPGLGFGFLLGFFLHILADSFTREGVVPLYPIKKRIHGKIITGGVFEETLFIIFFIFSLLLLYTLFKL